jgi:penicillin-binding protein 1A
MAGVVLASLTEQGHRPVRLPSLVAAYDFTSRDAAAAAETVPPTAITPNRIIADAARPLLRTLLQAPLCHTHAGVAHGTLKTLHGWCPDQRNGLRLHFAKTGTSVGADINATVDTWIAGGVQFSSGAAYSYVVLVGTGTPSQPWARSLHAAQVAAPLLETLLIDLKEHARRHGVAAAPARPVAAAAPPADVLRTPAWRERVFDAN